MPRRWLLAAAVVPLAILPLHLPRLASATSIIQCDMACLVSRADRIVVGTITQKMTNPNGGTLLGRPVPVSAYTMAITEVLKGTAKPGDSFTFEQVGGAVGSARTLRPIGISGYAVGQEYLLFLKAQAGGGWGVVGMDQGKFTIKQGPGGGKVVENGFGNQWLFIGGAWGGAGGGAVGGAGAPKASPGKTWTKGEQGVIQQRGGPASYDEFVSIIRKLQK